MRLLMIGAPGAGKGTQAVRVAEQFGVRHISSGDLLRDHVKRETSIGRTAKEYIERGDLVPDAVVLDMLRKPVVAASEAGGYVLDGFPRTVAQAVALDEMLAAKGLRLDAVVEFKVDEDALVDRIAKRAAETEARGEAVRKDDTPEVFKTRLDAYRRQTAPLSAHYAGTGLLRTVDGMAPIDAVTQEIEALLRGLQPVSA